jgi:Ca2+-binding EF-hand superfamily protein
MIRRGAFFSKTGDGTAALRRLYLQRHPNTGWITGRHDGLGDRQMKTSAYWITGALVLVMGTASMAAAKGGPMMDPSRLDSMFTALDTDEDGKITTEEFAAAKAKRFAEADADGDGLLSTEEMSAMALKMRDQARETRAQKRSARMVEKLDSDSDGKLSLEELAAAPGPERMLTKLDSDADGALSRDELAALKDKMGKRHGKGHDHEHGQKQGHKHGHGKGGGTPWWLQ